MTYRITTFALLALLASCARPASSPEGSELVFERTAVGDTTVIRVVSGSEWGQEMRLVPEVEIGIMDGDLDYIFGRIVSLAVGEDGVIYAVDSQVPALKAFHPDGSLKGVWGREGGGPGELAQVDGGLAVLSDGRIAVRDPGNARIQIFSAEGEGLETWPVIPGGFNTSNQFARSGDTLMSPIIVDLTVDVADWRSGYVRIGSEGEILDTLPFPEETFEVARIEVRREGSTSINKVPFAPDQEIAWHPGGYFIEGISDRYAFTLGDPAGPVRIERTVELPQVNAAERDEEMARATRSMRYTDPNWRWNGPPVPDHKPAFEGFYVADDGRIWVHRAGPGVEVEDPLFDPSDPDAVENRWRDANLFDVFEADGTFMGTAEAPLNMSIYPAPFFRGDNVWAVTRDEFDVQRIVRYRVVPKADEEE